MTKRRMTHLHERAAAGRSGRSSDPRGGSHLAARAGARAARSSALLRRRESGPLFGARLVAALVITFAAIGSMAYVLLAGELRRNQLSTYAGLHAADVHNIRAIVDRAHGQAETVREIDELLVAIGRRPGTHEALLIDDHGVIRASGTSAASTGSKESDPKVDVALGGRSYAGQESESGEDERLFEFIGPVDLPAGRFAFEVTYDARFLEQNLRDTRRALLLVGLLALIVGGVVFYLVGGRSLMRSHRVALERAIRDGLTDLPNHRAFQDDLQLAVASATRHHQPLALAVVDLDDFKYYNDRHGHQHGDALLRRVAAALREGRLEHPAYRTGGDEFAMLLPRLDADGAASRARKLIAELTNAAVPVKVSIGVGDLRAGQSADGLRAEADAALYEAKRRGGHGAVEFGEICDHVHVTTSEKTEAVRRLLADDGMCTVFQPIWDLRSNTLLGVEALTRPDPDYDLTGPAEAFDIAEQIGCGRALDKLCVEHALQIRPELRDGALLFINLSPQTLDLDSDGSDWLRTAVRRAGLAPDNVVVEVTERLGGRAAAVTATVQRLRSQGFKLAIDDVGTGNSGLQMLRSVDAEYVKIDRSIVVAAATEPAARAVLKAMATYAHETGSFVIAEGIEDRDTLDFLRAIDDRDTQLARIIQGGQGFGLGRPNPHVPHELPRLLRDTANDVETTTPRR